jgi:hypothetical protein
MVKSISVKETFNPKPHRLSFKAKEDRAGAYLLVKLRAKKNYIEACIGVNEAKRLKRFLTSYVKAV